MSKFTPGPWWVDIHGNVMAAGGMVAFPGISAGFDQAANARLIASAPDLLEALETLLPMVQEWHDEFPRDVGDKEAPAIAFARAAIAKATGSAS